MQISEKYNPQETEQKWYNYWLENNYFHSTPDNRPPYTIVIPPPNVTGILHMGHMLNNTIQDVLVRRARMQGFNALWVPGTDHASIATEAKVVAKLKSEGINKSDITRDEFLVHAWDWTHKYGGTILEQLKKLGCSCDWERTRFTMEPKLSAQVIKSFVDLYNKGLIYRGYRMVNWDPEAKTNISDEEVIYKELNGKLWYLKYKIEGSEEFISVATTRPETIFGDVAVCVNPNDEKYAHLKGKNVIVPIVNSRSRRRSVFTASRPPLITPRPLPRCRSSSVWVPITSSMPVRKTTAAPSCFRSPAMSNVRATTKFRWVPHSRRCSKWLAVCAAVAS